MNALPTLFDWQPLDRAAELEEAFASAGEYVKAEKSDATRRAYRSDARHFAAWCAAHGLHPIPASVDAVAAYMASLADAGLKASTITRRAAAIRYAHLTAGLEPPTSSEAVKAVLRGIRRRLGTAPVRKAPATADAIMAMLTAIPDTLRGKRDRALLAIGFAAALRRSELVALDVGDVEETLEGVHLHIRRSKTDQEGAGESVAIPHGYRIRPVEALQCWLDAAAIRRGPMFCSIVGGRPTGVRLSDRSAASVVKSRARAAGLDPAIFSGHSLRSGFVTSALASGADILRVMDVTRHREVRTLKAYDRRAKAFRDHAGSGFL